MTSWRPTAGAVLAAAMFLPRAVTGDAGTPHGAGVHDGPGPTEIQKLWALATGAVLFEVNASGHETLTGRPETRVNREAQQRNLAVNWGVRDRKDLLAAMDRVEREGHHAAFLELAGTWLPKDPDRWSEFKRRNADAVSDLHRIEVVFEYAEELGERGLKGWDDCRYIMLCRWGYECGYLSVAEAWDLMMPVARRLQTMFGSWEELGRNNAIGFKFWSFRRYHDALGERWLILANLLRSPNNP